MKGQDIGKVLEAADARVAAIVPAREGEKLVAAAIAVGAATVIDVVAVATADVAEADMPTAVGTLIRHKTQCRRR